MNMIGKMFRKGKASRVGSNNIYPGGLFKLFDNVPAPAENPC